MQTEETYTETIAFFDLDHTLLDGSNGSIYAKLMVDRDMAENKTLLWITWYTILYKLNMLAPEEVYRKTLILMGRFPILDFIDFLNEGYEQHIMPRLFAGGVEVIKDHRDRGHMTVICTAAGEYIAERVRAQLGADDIIATATFVEDGRVSERMASPAAYGEGKLELARRFVSSRGVDLKDCYFYSDSASDLPLLEAVGHPVLVNPQLRLRMMVRGRGWPVIRFREHASFPEPARPRSLPTPDLDRYLKEYESRLASG